MTMMSQNSQRNGQPRENCRLAPEYRSSLSRSKRGTGESGSSTVSGSLYSASGMPASKSLQNCGQTYSASPAITVSARSAYFSGHSEA